MALRTRQGGVRGWFLVLGLPSFKLRRRVSLDLNLSLIR